MGHAEGDKTVTVARACGTNVRRSAIRTAAASIGVLTIMVFSGLSGVTADSGMPTYTIHAVRYDFNPAEIDLKKGQTVRLVFIADDVAHGIAIPDLGVDLELPKHKAQTVTITPSAVGDFDGECSKYCGTGHSDMTFLVRVRP